MTVFGVFIVLSSGSSFALSQRTLLCTTVHHLSLHFPREAQRAVRWAEVAGPSRSMRSLVADTGRDRTLREQFLPPRPSSCWYEIRLIATSLVPCVAGDGGHNVCPPSPLS